VGTEPVDDLVDELPLRAERDPDEVEVGGCTLGFYWGAYLSTTIPEPNLVVSTSSGVSSTPSKRCSPEPASTGKSQKWYSSIVWGRSPVFPDVEGECCTSTRGARRHVHGSAVNATSEREWLRKLIDACRRALQDLRDRPAPENQALEEDLERFCTELEERLRLLRSDEA
jgi:hypothetical protein